MDKRHQPRGDGEPDDAQPDQTGDRRARTERRRAAGLLELRARREGIDGDRRRSRTTRSRLWSLWRRARP